MTFFSRVPCRVRLFIVSGLLSASTALAALAQVFPLGRTMILAMWGVALVGGSVAMGALAWTAHDIMSTLKRLAQRAEAIAAGDLTGEPIHVESHDELADLAQSIDHMERSLQGIIAGMMETSATLLHDTAELSQAGAQASNRTSEQSAQTHQAASAMQEMSISIAEVSGHAQNAADQARKAASAAREGGKTVEEMLTGMNTISESVSRTAATVQRLGNDSEQIIRIVNVIEEIAEKTNLLALNAAIEAARAGEQGRGFAVVAGEVRRLAESTRSATSEIAQMVDTITGNTKAAVEAMASGTERVGHGMEITSRAGQSLQHIIAAADQVESMIAQIATASTEQSVAAQEFSRNLEVINRLGEESTAATPVTGNLVASVRAGADRLQESVGRFRIAESSVASSAFGVRRPEKHRRMETVARTPAAALAAH